MTEHFVSFCPMAYPPCRLEVMDDPVNAAQKCFTSCYDIELLDDKTRSERIVTYVNSNGKIEKFIDVFHEGECMTIPCPLLEKVLYCRFSIGDLSDEEVDIFKQKSDLDNHPDFILQSKADVGLASRAEQIEHQEALNRSVKQFESYRRNSLRYDSHGKYMAELEQIAKTIIASRVTSQPDNSAIESATPSIGTVADTTGSKSPEPLVGKKSKGKTLSPPKTKIEWERLLAGIYEQYPETKTYSSPRLLLFLKDWARTHGVEIDISDSRIRQLQVWKDHHNNRGSGKTRHGYDLGNSVDDTGTFVKSHRRNKPENKSDIDNWEG